MKQTAAQRKDALLEQFVRQREAIRTVIAGFSPAAQQQVFLGVWSSLDLLAHLTGWDDANDEAVRAVLSGRLPAFYTYAGKDWADFNALLVSRYRIGTSEAMLAANRSAQQRLLEQIGQISPADFIRDFGVRYHGYRVTVERLIQSEAADEGIHLEQILAFVQFVNKV